MQTGRKWLIPDFLRQSRSLIDDTIVQQLNALANPAHQRWSPASTAIRPLPDRPFIAADACVGFRDQVLFPAWQTRSQVLHYCAGVAVDPNDPDLILRQLESAEDRNRVVDERLDPYSGRFVPRETRTERLAEVVRNERSIEDIVRARTWRLMREKCGPNVAAGSWQDVWAQQTR